MQCEMCIENIHQNIACQGGECLGQAVAVKVAEAQNMASHVLRIALVLWPCKQGKATKLREVNNRQAEMAIPTKCRDSQLRFSPCGIPSTFGALPREHMSRDKSTETPRRECWCLAAPPTWTTD
jgi:hypothetical protein